MNEFNKGDFVKYVGDCKGITEYLIVIRPINDTQFLCVMCKSTQTKKSFEIMTGLGKMFVLYMSFCSVDFTQISSTEYMLKNKYAVIDEIYAKREIIKEKRKEKIKRQIIVKEIRKKQKGIKRKQYLENKQRKKEKEKFYQKQYELAAMNNDTVKMKEIEKTLGYAPIGKGKQGRSYYKIYTRTLN